ncbi:MAG: DsbA family oxidoreductase [Jatrophihabitans sp.]|uniref:DsbA family oxidoreductase n=1 Tax=Jatrophihabitans sp. TaxID=1932789 RepID=UPI003F812565
MPIQLTFYSDVVCPWATVMILRLRAARERADADEQLRIIHRALPLELEHRMAIPRRVVDAEIPLCASLTPDFGWSLWQGRLDEYPVTVLTALEAVRAAGAQSLAAGEELDLALRHAFFARSRCIALRHEILAVARTCPSVDVDALAAALDSGVHRAAVHADFGAAKANGVPCSGTFVLPGGRMLCNPGTGTGWIGGAMPRGTPTLVADDPTAYDRIVADLLDSAPAAGRGSS